MNNISLKTRLDFAIKIAVDAGKIVISEREKSLTQENKKFDELVTSADLKADKFISDKIRENYPNEEVFTEESSISDIPTTKGITWIVDPIDGTVNFAHNHPFFAISIGMAIDAEINLGVVHCPMLGETFTAIKNEGAYLNERRLKTSTKPNLLKNSVIATGFPYDRNQLDYVLGNLKKIMLHCTGMRRCGSAAIDLCWVAANRVDGYYETVKIWDIAAARIIASEAGIVMGNFTQSEEDIPLDYRCKDFLAASSSIYNDLLKILTS